MVKLRTFALTLVLLAAQNSATDGTRWWSHIQFLADDALEGRNVGTPGFEKAAAYVESSSRRSA